MCGRSSLYEEPQEMLASYALPTRLPGFIPRFNIAPSQNQWAIVRAADGRLEVRALRWGLVPSWSNDPAIGSRMINARAETIAEKASYRDALHTGRCLIIADGYYEWAGAGKAKTPYRFQMKTHRPFVFAGLWDRWEKGATPIESCTIITTQAGRATSHIHHRVPVILSFPQSLTWLSKDSEPRELMPLLRAYTEADLEMFAVSRAVNDTANDTAECIQPVESLSPELPF